MDFEVVEDDHVAGSQRRHEHLVDVRAKGQVVDRPVEDRRSLETLQP